MMSPALRTGFCLPLDLDGHLPIDHEEQFLRTRMHMPRRRSACRHLQDVDNCLLDLPVLAVEIAAQDLRELRPGLRSLSRYGFRARRHRRRRRSCELQQAATSQNHDPVPPTSYRPVVWLSFATCGARPFHQHRRRRAIPGPSRRASGPFNSGNDGISHDGTDLGIIELDMHRGLPMEAFFPCRTLPRGMFQQHRLRDPA